MVYFLLANTKLSFSSRTEEQRLYFVLNDVRSNCDVVFHAWRLFPCQRECWPVYWQLVERMETCVTAYLKCDVPAGGACTLVHPVSGTGWGSKQCWGAERLHASVHVCLCVWQCILFGGKHTSSIVLSPLSFHIRTVLCKSLAPLILFMENRSTDLLKYVDINGNKIYKAKIDIVQLYQAWKCYDHFYPSAQPEFLRNLSHNFFK